MADNFTFKDASGTSKTAAAKELAGGEFATEPLITFDDGSTGQTRVGAANPLPVGGGVAEDAAAADNPLQMGLEYSVTLPTVDDGDVVGWRGSAGGVAYVHILDSSDNIVDPDQSQTGPNAITVVDSLQSAVIDLADDTANQSIVAAPGADHQIWVYGIFMKADGTGNTVTLQDEDDTALSGSIVLGANDGFVVNPSGNFEMPWIKLASNKALEADVSDTGGVIDGIITYAVVDVS